MDWGGGNWVKGHKRMTWIKLQVILCLKKSIKNEYKIIMKIKGRQTLFRYVVYWLVFKLSLFMKKKWIFTILYILWHKANNEYVCMVMNKRIIKENDNWTSN